ncbi:MAG: GNAT family N-acetyltransferase [Nanoarchaeota archaeon]|nr:GNAT family N-acetyltransferase [Nanoarchaeota archaeon]
MRILKAKISDAKKISTMRKKNIERILSGYYKKEVIQKLLEKNSVKYLKPKIKEREMFCIWENKTLLGTVDLKDNKIGGLFIKHDQINKGYGKELMKFIENHAKKKGVKKVKLYPTKNALQFYKRLGYKIKSNIYWKTDKFKIPVPVMEKKLKL